MATEQVLGSDVHVGDVLRIEGYRWTVVEAPVRGPGNMAGQMRYSITVEPADDAARALGSPFSRWSSGLRVDLTWTREVQECGGDKPLCDACCAAIAASDAERKT